MKKEKMLISTKSYLDFIIGVAVIADRNLNTIFKSFKFTDEMTKEFFKEKEKIDMKKIQKDLASNNKFLMN